MTGITVVCLLLMVLGNVSAYPSRRDDWLAAIAGGGGSCVDAGFTGCCEGSLTACTLRQSGQRPCSCHKNCSISCCSDILATGCEPAPTCAYARLRPGCCNLPHPVLNCKARRNSEFCYCDSACKGYGDCCLDVPVPLRCSKTENNMLSHLASLMQDRPIFQHKMNKAEREAILMARELLESNTRDDEQKKSSGSD